jgi:AraC-like DNA-binding protein
MQVLDELMRELNVELGAFSYDGKNRFHIIKRALVKEYSLDKILFDILSYDDSDKYKRLLIMSKLIEFIINIDKMVEKNKDNFVRPSSCDNLITAATKYIDEHISEPIRLDTLADELYVSKSTLCHKFSSVMNMTTNNYISLKKMHYATELLREGYSAGDVAAMVGYDNYTSFFYNYKRVIGVSPTVTGKTD